MGEWYTVRVLRKEKYFELNTGTFFNLNDITGVSDWINPQFFYSIKDWKGNNINLDTRISIDGSYPNYYLSTIENGASALVSIYVCDGDGERENISDEGSGEFVTIKPFYKKKIVTLSQSNNWSIDVSDMGMCSKYHFMYNFLEVDIPVGITRFYFNTINLGNNKFKCNFKSICTNDFSKRTYLTRQSYDTTHHIKTNSPFILVYTDDNTFESISEWVDVDMYVNGTMYATTKMRGAYYKGNASFFKPTLVNIPMNGKVDIKFVVRDARELYHYDLSYYELNYENVHEVDMLLPSCKLQCMVMGEE